MSKIRSFSFRLNMDVESERKLYEDILSEISKYPSNSAFMKAALDQFFKAKWEKDVVEALEASNKARMEEVARYLKEELTERFMSLTGALMRVIGSDTCNASEPNALPLGSETLPEGVLDFIR